MQLTNKQNLPAAIVRAVSADDHRGADYSASMLSKSPRMVWLDRRHQAEITEDVSERIWALIGKACHYVVEKADAPNTLHEGYLEMQVLEKILSGTFDLFDGKTLSDIKTVSVYQIKHGSAIPDWEKQVNTYAHLLRQIGFVPEAVEVIAICRDWSKRTAQREEDYPQAQVVLVPLRLWSAAEAQAHIEARIGIFEEHSLTTDDALPDCTPFEMWEKPAVYAVMKVGRKSAVKLHDDKAAADAHAATLGTGHSVTHRPGERVRCADYCRVAPFCSQHKKWLSENTSAGLGAGYEQ